MNSDTPLASKKLNLFYEDPEGDRWLPLDRYPRRIIRRIVRGQPRVGGQKRVFLNLCAGLKKLGIDYRVNDYRYVKKHPSEPACIIGKPHVLDKIPWQNPIIFGAAVHSHPLNDTLLLGRLPVRKVLVPGEWMREMFEPYYGESVVSWPVGIDTESWDFDPGVEKSQDILLYDKVRWEHDYYEEALLNPIRRELQSRDLSFSEIRYGYYEENDFLVLLKKCRAMIFLCEHETQGIAYQQALSCGVPILAWDRGGYWQDPEFYPERIKFGPVTSVPYWDDRCGVKFGSVEEFPESLSRFMERLQQNDFSPRDYILENLTLEKCARQYVGIVRSVASSLPD
jgi:glycosyltransferase involved in cell wall biosynthesis